ncbi:C163A protein, partial [Psilopogon haemacephalus]|nr:C163A protein [Psilopogon haemacephalus]
PGSGPIWMDEVECDGSESALSDCRHRGWGQHKCVHDWDVGVICSGAAELRLADGSRRCAGRVEVKHQGQWGTVCDDSWNLKDAAVVCRQLGCESALEATSGERFGPGSGPIWMSHVVCNGSESALSDCTHQRQTQHYCDHAEDVGVICS